MFIIKNLFDIKIAYFNSKQEIDFKLIENEGVDLIQVNGFAPGGIYHSSKMVWIGNLNRASKNLNFIRSNREQKAVLKNKAQLSQEGCQVKVQAFDQNLYDQFCQLYQRTTAQRVRKIDDSPQSAIFGPMQAGSPIYLVGLFQQEKLIAGLSFRRKGKSILVNLAAKERRDDLRGGYGGVLELALLDFGLEHKLDTIYHGDRSYNPVGLINKAGLFEFKNRYGYTAYPSENWTTTWILNPNIALSDLVFVGFIDEQVGYTVVSDSSLGEVAKKYGNEEVQKVRVLKWDELEDMNTKLSIEAKN